MRQAQMLLKLKRIKRQISFPLKPFGHSVSEREREKKTLREGRTAGAGAEEATSQRQISDE